MEVISASAAHTGALLCADYAVLLVVQGDNAFGVVQLEHAFRRKCAADDSWRARTAAELRDYAEAIESGRVQLGSYNVADTGSGETHAQPTRGAGSANPYACTHCGAYREDLDSPICKRCAARARGIA